MSHKQELMTAFVIIVLSAVLANNLIDIMTCYKHVEL
jgi:hypothetical protein